MLREFLPETLVLPRNALGRNGNPALILGDLHSPCTTWYHVLIYVEYMYSHIYELK